MNRVSLNSFISIILILFLFNCSNSNAGDDESIKNTLIKMWYAIEIEDIDEYAKYVHPDFTQFGETDPVLQIGKNAEIQGIKNQLGTYPVKM